MRIEQAREVGLRLIAETLTINEKARADLLSVIAVITLSKYEQDRRVCRVNTKLTCNNLSM